MVLTQKVDLSFAFRVIFFPYAVQKVIEFSFTSEIDNLNRKTLAGIDSQFFTSEQVKSVPDV